MREWISFKSKSGVEFTIDRNDIRCLTQGVTNDIYFFDFPDETGKWVVKKELLTTTEYNRLRAKLFNNEVLVAPKGE